MYYLIYRCSLCGKTEKSDKLKFAIGGPRHELFEHWKRQPLIKYSGGVHSCGKGRHGLMELIGLEEEYKLPNKSFWSKLFWIK